MITELYTVYRTELFKYCCMICGNEENGTLGGMLGAFPGMLKDTQVINAAEYKM